MAAPRWRVNEYDKLLSILIIGMNKELEIRSYPVIFIMGFLTSLCSFVASYSHVFLSQLEKVISAKDDISPAQISAILTMVVSASFMGQVIGPFLYKSLADKYGERGAMIRCYLTIIVAISVQLIDLQLTFLLSSRLVMGIVIGVQASILPLYLSSVAPISVSGKIGSMNQLLTCYGVIFAYVLGFIVDQDKDDEIRWRIMVGFPIIPCILSIVSLKWLFPYDCLERHIQKREMEALQSYADRIYLNATIEDIQFEKTHHCTKSVSEQYKRELQRYILAMVVIGSCQLTGINAIFLYAKQLFQEITDNDMLLSQQLMVGLALCQLLSCSISGRFIDSFGRKYLLVRGQFGLIIILAAIFLVDSYSSWFKKDIQHYILICLIYSHIIIFNFSLGPVCIIYAAELVTNITPIIVTKRMVNLMVAISTNYLMHRYGIGPLFLLYGVLSLVAHSYLRDRLRQTKGKSKIQVLQMFQTSMKESEPDERRLMV